MALCGTPNSWNKEIDCQGFDPMQKTLSEVIDFMEQLEASEDFDPNAIKVPKKSDKEKSSSNKSNKTGTKFCLHHGNGNHTSDECEYLKRLAANKNKAIPSLRSRTKLGNAMRPSRRSTRTARRSLLPLSARLFARR